MVRMVPLSTPLFFGWTISLKKQRVKVEKFRKVPYLFAKTEILKIFTDNSTRKKWKFLETRKVN
jgi:hypothetical protein